MSSIKNYLSLVKFSHTIFAMPFAIIGFVLGYKFFTNHNLNTETNLFFSFQHSSWQAAYFLQCFILVIVCMIMARSAAMAFNRYLDREFDARNPRTAVREIPAGIIKANHALTFTLVCCLTFMAACFFINKIVLLLSPIALFVVLFYSYTKRFTALCHLVLGVGLSLAPVGAYVAVTATFNWLPVLFGFLVLSWVSGFDIIYALQDEEFDKQNKLHSIPAKLGKAKALLVSKLLHFVCALLVVGIGYFFGFSWLYWAGALLFILMLIYQHSIVTPQNLNKVNIAFMTANGIASIVFATLVITDILLLNK